MFWHPIMFDEVEQLLNLGKEAALSLSIAFAAGPAFHARARMYVRLDLLPLPRRPFEEELGSDQGPLQRRRHRRKKQRAVCGVCWRRCKPHPRQGLRLPLRVRVWRGFRHRVQRCDGRNLAKVVGRNNDAGLHVGDRYQSDSAV